ncbi:hypothetical protein [Anaerococcus porci]|uniref:hypothetical protein n=1 Tax=Anaerococcus porci TaxID=2652269 RepID=UPI002A748F73|nr:hypothetical protein [Anaerococcus porci]MDY3005523.1 hypothetical protein [Anaerococcus porci]
MKDLLYISHPLIDEISANIKKKKYNYPYTKLILDRSIFIPKTAYLLDENPEISSFKIKNIQMVEKDIVYTIEGNIEKKEVYLKIDKKARLKNLYYNTAFYIFKAIFYQFYNNKNISLSIEKNKSRIKVDNFYENFDLKAFKELFEKIIKLGLDINIEEEEIFIDGFERFPNQGVFLRNTKYLEGIYVFSLEKIEDKLLIDFIVGDDYLKFVSKSMDLIEYIKNISTGDLDSSEKITKIISAIQNQKY